MNILVSPYVELRARSMVLFLSCILSFIWRTGSVLDPPDRSPLMPDAAFGVRVGISGVLALGFVYAIMIVKTLRRYGARMDEAWTNRALAWQMENVPYPATPYHRRSIYRPNKPGPIYGTRTRLPLYRPEREDDARSDIELGSTRFSTIPSQTRTPDGRVTGGPPMPQEERSALFSNSVIPELINDAGQSVRPSTPPASRPVLPSEADHIPRLPTPLPSVVPIPNPPDQPDSFIIPTLFFRLANLPAMRPAFPTMKIQDNMANFQETVPSIPSELDLYYDVYADEWSRFLHVSRQYVQFSESQLFLSRICPLHVLGDSLCLLESR
jgi:hypothetical protein